MPVFLLLEWDESAVHAIALQVLTAMAQDGEDITVEMAEEGRKRFFDKMMERAPEDNGAVYDALNKVLPDDVEVLQCKLQAQGMHERDRDIVKNIDKDTVEQLRRHVRECCVKGLVAQLKCHLQSQLVCGNDEALSMVPLLRIATTQLYDLNPTKHADAVVDLTELFINSVPHRSLAKGFGWAQLAFLQMKQCPRDKKKKWDDAMENVYNKPSGNFRKAHDIIFCLSLNPQREYLGRFFEHRGALKRKGENFQSALDDFNSALAEHTTSGAQLTEEYATVLGNRGTVYAQMAGEEEAEADIENYRVLAMQDYTQAKSIRNKTDTLRTFAGALLYAGIAELLEAQKQYADAQCNYQEAWDIRKAAGMFPKNGVMQKLQKSIERMKEMLKQKEQ